MDALLPDIAREALQKAEKALNDIAHEDGSYPDQEHARDLCSEVLDQEKHFMLLELAKRKNEESRVRQKKEAKS